MNEPCNAAGIGGSLPGHAKAYILGAFRGAGIGRVSSIMCILTFAVILQSSTIAGAGDAYLQLADARSDADANCRKKLGPGAVAEEEFSFGETSYVCNCASPYTWNKGNTRCVQNKSEQDAEPQTDTTQSKEDDASTELDANQQAQVPSQPITKCDELAAHPDDTSNATRVGVTFNELQKNPQPAISACRLALSKTPGSPRIAFQLARALNSAKNYSEAFGPNKKAAEAGHVVAMVVLGNMYAQGEGVSRDYAEAVRWYRKAVDKGDAVAMKNLGIMYKNGRGVSLDLAEAIRWYREAAELGNANAMASLGFMYERGKGVSRDYAEAVRWYRKAADKGDAGAMNNLGYMYKGGRGISLDLAEAIRWYRKAAELGHATAMANLGANYARGEGVSRDYAEAVHWLRKAADKGDAGAMLRLGRMYLEGLGTAQSDVEAVRWYRKAADRGQSTAMHNLSGMLREGRGVARDNKKAAQLMLTALLKGNKYSVDLMTNAPNQTNKQFRQELQRLMKKNGIYDGPIDGDFGPKSKRAIRKLAGRTDQ